MEISRLGTDDGGASNHHRAVVHRSGLCQNGEVELTGKRAWAITGIAAVIYAAIMAALLLSKAITVADVWRNVAVAIGWLLTITLAMTQLNVTKSENERQKRHDRRAGVEIEAFKQIASASVDLTKALSAVGSPFGVGAVTFKSPPIIPDGQSHIRLWQSARTAQVELYRAWSQFVFSIEAYQIALLPFEHLRIYIGFRVQDAAAEIQRVSDVIPYWQPAIDDEMRTQIASSCDRIWRDVWDIQTYVGDYRVEVMNQLTGSLFDKQVPRRKPLHPAKKNLVELASRESVEREDQRRVQEAILAVHESANSSRPPA